MTWGAYRTSAFDVIKVTRCLSSNWNESIKLVIKNKKEKLSETNKILTVKDVVDLYLTKVIIDSRSGVKKNIQGARKLKGKLEARWTLYADVIAVLGHM